jgi:aminopeptidase
MDERISAHAKTVVDWSARIDAGDDVVVSVAEGAHDLAVAVAATLGDRGANVVTTYDSEEVTRAYLRENEDSFDADPTYEQQLYANADVVLSLGGSTNAAAMADVSEQRRSAYRRARRGIREARLDTDWVSTVHPTRADAQRADMAFEQYREFLYDAVLRDWESLAEEMGRLKSLLDDGEQVRLYAEGTDGVRTDLTLSIAGRTAVNSAASVAYDSHNLPSGEVFTAPVVDSVDGVVTFDVPVTVDDRPVHEASLTFENGEVAAVTASQGKAALLGVIDTDDGARRLGELGIGMNRGIDRPTGQILFDEKMAGTVHLALGRAYDACLPAGEAGNDSAVHQDLIADMSGSISGTDVSSCVEIDGDVIQRDGLFRWEDDFEQ